MFGYLMPTIFSIALDRSAGFTLDMVLCLFPLSSILFFDFSSPIKHSRALALFDGSVCSIMLMTLRREREVATPIISNAFPGNAAMFKKRRYNNNNNNYQCF